MTRPQQASDPARRFVDVRGGRTAYIDEGEGGVPFLLVHGIPGSARDWRWLTPVLAPHRRVVRVDMPGHGETPRSVDVDVASRAHFVLDFAAALELPKVILVGHSMGGVVAAAAANLAPDRVAAVAFVSSPGLRVHRGFRGAPYGLVARVLAHPLGERMLREPMRKSFVAAGFRHASSAERVHSVRCVAATSIARHVTELTALRQPRLSAFCVDDPLVDPAILEDTASALGGPVLRFPGGGHNPQKHHADELGAALLAWDVSGDS